MIKKIFIGLAVVIAGFLVFVALKPSYGEISREVTINAPAEKIFPYVNTRTMANSWNPWLKSDPKAKITTAGPEVGTGSQTLWEGGEQLGKGSATVIESIPNERVDVKLEYVEPFKMEQTASYLLKPNGDQTVVTWKVAGHAPFVNRLFCVFFDMEKMVGDEFSKGLAELKTMVESAK